MVMNAKDSIYAGGIFVGLPPQLVRDGSISNNAVRLYAVLKSYANSDGYGAYPGRERIARHMGECSLKTVERAIKELEQALWLFVERGRNDHGNWTSNRYILAGEKGVKPRRARLEE